MCNLITVWIIKTNFYPACAAPLSVTRCQGVYRALLSSPEEVAFDKNMYYMKTAVRIMNNTSFVSSIPYDLTNGVLFNSECMFLYSTVCTDVSTPAQFSSLMQNAA